jgi:hypothetical protein
MKLIVNVPINSLSFGNVAVNLLREMFKEQEDVAIFPIGDKVEVDAFDKTSNGFRVWLQNSINNRFHKLSSEIPTLKLWHLSGSETRFSSRQFLYTFHELDQITPLEKTLAEFQTRTIVSSSFSQRVFKESGVSVDFANPGFDEDFHLNGSNHVPDKVSWGLMGKFEKRKHTAKIVKSWLKKYGNNNKHVLNLCISNPFILPEQMKSDVMAMLGGQRFNNLNFLPYLRTNTEVNDYHNAVDIELAGASGAEGWGLPAFNATCLGRWAVVLQETAHKDWATSSNCVVLESSGKISSEDGRFFVKGAQFNQGDIYDWNEDAFISVLEKAEKLAKTPNSEGMKLKTTHSYANTWQKIKSVIEKE